MAVLNLGVIPGFTGLTLGKWAPGCASKEATAGLLASVAHCYVTRWLSLSFALLGLGFLIAAFSVHGRGLHDMIAGTIVVREGSSS